MNLNPGAKSSKNIHVYDDGLDLPCDLRQIADKLCQTLYYIVQAPLDGTVHSFSQTPNTFQLCYASWPSADGVSSIVHDVPQLEHLGCQVAQLRAKHQMTRKKKSDLNM